MSVGLSLTGMSRESTRFGLSIVVLIVGLLVVLWGEANGGLMTYVLAGGAITLLSVAWMAGYVSRV